MQVPRPAARDLPGLRAPQRGELALEAQPRETARPRACGPRRGSRCCETRTPRGSARTYLRTSAANPQARRSRTPWSSSRAIDFRSTPAQSRARRVVLRRRHRDSRLRSRSPLPRGIRPMLRAAAQVRRRPAPGSEVIPARSRDPVRAASTEGVTAVPPQQPPPDAARVRIVLRSTTSCASRKARNSQRQAGSDRTTRPSTSRPCPRPRAGSPGAGSPLRRSATHFARIDSELTPAPRIGEQVVRDRPCNRGDRARFASMPIVCRGGPAHPHVRFSHRVPPPHPRPSRVDRRPDGRHMGPRIAPRLDGLAGTTTHRPSRRPPATPPAHRRETHRANAGRRVVSGTLRPPEHAGRARRHGTRIERSSPCVS